MKKIVFLTFAILAGIGIIHLFAQQANKKKAVSTTPLQSKAVSKVEMDSPAVFLFPEFYSFWPVDDNDTVLKYECFDQHDSLLNADTLANMNAVQYIVLMKTHTDYTRTYIDPDGKPQPMPVTSHIYRYDKSGTDTWTGKSYASAGYTTYKEYRDQIVRADTTKGTNPITGNKQLTIRKYYKVEAENQ